MIASCTLSKGLAENKPMEKKQDNEVISVGLSYIDRLRLKEDGYNNNP